MSVPINKRQQIRNERTLQDLINNVAGNDRCADCSTGNPGWASWSLGIFLCIRCAAIHRKLGVHISRIKSLSMDAWTIEQVEKMKRVGNVSSNHRYNPKNIRPNIPIDIDEVDGVLERFIRQKYDSKTLSRKEQGESHAASRHDTGSTGSSEEHATAQLPPKPAKRFNFSLRSSSSVFSMRRSEPSPPLSPDPSGLSSSRRYSPSERFNKPSKIFGADIGGSRQDNYELKLIALREMGFPDDRRNLSILKGQDGNLDKAAATLLRLGESNSRPSTGQSSPAPATAVKGPLGHDTVMKALNPFDRLDINEKALPPPPAFEAAADLGTALASSATHNPFFQPSNQSILERQFQGLSVLQPSLLFPHKTSGHAGPDQHFSTNPFLQAKTPSLASSLSAPPPSQSMFGQFGQAGLDPRAMHQPQPNVMRVTGTGHPFLTSSPNSQYPSTNPSDTQQAQQAHVQVPQQQSNPFITSPGPTSAIPQPSPITTSLGPASTVSQTNPFWAGYEQSQFLPHTAPMIQSPHQFGCTDPFPTHGHTQSVPLPLAPKIDKASILALYDLPSPYTSVRGSTAQRLEAEQRSSTMPLLANATASIQNNHHLPAHTMGDTGPQQQQTAAGFQKAGSRGCFSSAFTHISHDSVDFTGMLSGRHSPDAFAGLSARLAR